MIEAFFLFKLIPASILDIYKVFEHIDMLSIGIGFIITWFMFVLPITWSLSTVVGMIKINDKEKCKLIADNFDHYANVAVAVQCRAHCWMEHIHSFTKSH
jgi:hypothetical protein